MRGATIKGFAGKTPYQDRIRPVHSEQNAALEHLSLNLDGIAGKVLEPTHGSLRN